MSSNDISDESASFMDDASELSSPVEDTIEDSECKLRKFLKRHRLSNTEIATILRRKVDDLQFQRPHWMYNLVGAYGKLIRMIRHEQDEVKRRPELVDSVAHTQAVRLRVEGMEAELEKRMHANADAEGDDEIKDFIGNEAPRRKIVQNKQGAKVRKAEDLEAICTKVSAPLAEFFKPVYVSRTKENEWIPVNHGIIDAVHDGTKIDE